LGFDIIQDAENRNRFYIHETYPDQAAFDDHCKGPHFQKALAALGPLLATPLTPLGVGVRIFPLEDA
jgi:autoinducer 2-degrading protein